MTTESDSFCRVVTCDRPRDVGEYCAAHTAPPSPPVAPEPAQGSQSGYLSPQATGLGGQLHQASSGEAAGDGVTHETARGWAEWIDEKCTGPRVTLLRYIDQQEQSEREVASLQMRLGEALGMLHEAEGHNTQPATWDQLIGGAKDARKQSADFWDQLEAVRANRIVVRGERDHYMRDRDTLRTQLTAAERKAEGLEQEARENAEGYRSLLKDYMADKDQHRETLAKLAESERKLARLHKLCANIVAGGSHGWNAQAALVLDEVGLSRTWSSEQNNALLASTEPAGVEVGNVTYANGHVFVGDIGNCDKCGEQFGARFTRECHVTNSEKTMEAIVAAIGQPGPPPIVTSAQAPRRFSCSSPGCSCRKEPEAADPTPTETEAPARFRVGQRVRWRVNAIKPNQPPVDLICQIKTLTAITAAVVGVIVNLALFFGQHVLWPAGFSGTFDWIAAVVALAAGLALFAFRRSVMEVIAACAITGLLVRTLL